MANAKTSKTMAVREVGGFLIFWHADVPPTDTEWDAGLEIYRRSSNIAQIRVFVYTEGAAPNAAQRARMTAAVGDRKPRIAVVTPSTMVRAAGTAIRWFVPGFRAFAPNEINGAFEHLGATASERILIERTLEELKHEVLGPGGRQAGSRSG